METLNKEVTESHAEVTGLQDEERDTVNVRVVHTSSDPESDPRREIPVLGFRDYWYPVVSERKVPRRKPLYVKLLGDELCVFRGKTSVAVVSDRCPHRGASLSGGKCHYSGTVSCPYHGWTFDETGACKAVISEGPGDISSIPGKVSVRHYPTVTIHGVVFAWMGEGEPTPPERDLPLELFDGSFIQHDATIWHLNWRPALENLSDNHTGYIHRNAIQVLMQPFMKFSYKGARTLLSGGGCGLTYYSDGTERTRPYREYFPEVDGFWPKHAYRRSWIWIFALRPLHWMWKFGDGYPPSAWYHPGSHEWNSGPHMPGMQRICGGSALYTRWCVPIDENSTKEFYMWATRPKSSRSRFWKGITYIFAQRLFRNRNLGFQDGNVLAKLRYDLPERFSNYDLETMGWRRLAILSARYGGRHDRIPIGVLNKLNQRAIADLRTRNTAIPADVQAMIDADVM